MDRGVSMPTSPIRTSPTGLARTTGRTTTAYGASRRSTTLRTSSGASNPLWLELRGSGSFESPHAPGEGLHDREADLRILLQRPQERAARQVHHSHGVRRGDRRRPGAAGNPCHLPEEVARPQDPRLAENASSTLEHQIERIASVAGLNDDLSRRVVDDHRELCKSAKLTLAQPREKGKRREDGSPITLSRPFPRTPHEHLKRRALIWIACSSCRSHRREAIPVGGLFSIGGGRRASSSYARLCCRSVRPSVRAPVARPPAAPVRASGIDEIG